MAFSAAHKIGMAKQQKRGRRLMTISWLCWNTRFLPISIMPSLWQQGDAPPDQMTIDGKVDLILGATEVQAAKPKPENQRKPLKNRPDKRLKI